MIQQRIPFEGPIAHFDQSVLSFRDPDGLMLELVADANAQEYPVWAGGTVPAEHTIHGIYSVALCEDGYELTAKLLTETLGFHLLERKGNVFRYAIAEGGLGNLVHVRCAPDFWRGVVAVGTVHHVAWRVRNDEEQEAWHQTIAGMGINVSPVLDRNYFHSI